MSVILTVTIIGIVLVITIPVGLFLGIRYFIRYNAEQKRNKTKQQEEMNKMNIEDLG